VQYVPGPVGVQSRNFSNARIYSLGWRPKTSLREGMQITYEWIEQQLRKGAAVVEHGRLPASAVP
jgi:nucleoside-diphosphate-sugar epimerase